MAPLTDFEQAEEFLSPLSTASVNYVPTHHPLRPEIDFHRMISTLGQYPVLLRLFGLVVDLEVPVPASPPATGDLQVTPTWTPSVSPPSTDVTPTTSTDTSTFLATPRAFPKTELSGGQLRMSDDVPYSTEPAYPVIELELDGSALKTVNFARGVYRATSGVWRTDFTPDAYAPPALRSAGLAVAHTGQGLSFGTAMQTADSLNSPMASSPPGPVELFAEDVTRGFRIDVWDDATNLWHQLCARVAAPTPGGLAIGRAPHVQLVAVPSGDEGWVELSLAQGNAGGADDSYLSELILRWGGWSLVAPRPGEHLTAAPADGLEANQNNPATGAFPLQASFAAAPGTLPALRFGRSYRFRARAVDLAGNGLAFDPTATAVSFAWATAPQLYGRMEPVQSPPLIPHDASTPGEHLERIVVRSEFYDTPDASVTPSSRHVVPPSTSEEMAEAHGAIDTPGKTPDVAFYSVIAPLEGLTYSSPSVVTGLGGLDDPNVATGQQIVYYPVDNLAVPYLPDVFARGACLQNVPGYAATLQIPFGDTTLSWPSTRAFRIQVLGGSGAPVLPTAGNDYTLTIYAPKATFQVMRLSCYLDAGDLSDMGLWEWLENAGLATSTLKALAASGEHFMFTPYREVTVVHAVRQPLTVPQFTSPYVTREEKKTFALFGDTIEVDFASSQKLDVYSQWQEPFDDGVSSTGSVMLQFNAPVGEIKLDHSDPTLTSITIPSATPPLPALRHDFGDTKYRLVYYEARSTSRFLEYFAEQATVTLTDGDPTTVDAGGMATGTVVVTGGSPEVIYEPTVDYTEDDDVGAGTLSAVVGGGIIPTSPGTAQVNVSYVPPPVTRSSFEEIVAPATALGYPVVVPSTARPAAPDVRYLLPLFSFSESTSSSPPAIESTRKGNAVRVYLGRPWWNSGDGELLGVLLYHSGGVPPDQYSPFGTRYGRDPLRQTNPVQPAPSTANFPGAATVQSLVDIPETEGSTLWDVAGHQVQFDTTHQLWFADIEIDLSTIAFSGVGTVLSYWPFVRLALVRYQPNSLAGVECSSVVQADFVQIAPDRIATLTFPAANEVTINVTGVDYTSGPSPEVGPSVITVTVQKQLPSVTDPDLAWVDLPTSTVTLSWFATPNFGVSWNGTVTLPGPKGSEPFRIRIQEFEVIAVLSGGTVPETASRTTYIETIEI